MKFKRRPYQKRMGAFMVAHSRCNIWASMGSGKTGTTFWALNQLFKIGELTDWDGTNGDRILILAPLRVASVTWPDEQEKWHFPNLRVVDGTGAAKWREQALNSDANVVCINYEAIEWLTSYYGDDWPFTVVVADESTKLKSFRSKGGSKRAKALGKVAHKAMATGKKIKRWINLTGTPSPNGLKDLWGQTWFLDAGARLGSSFTAYTERYFDAKRVGANAFAVQHIPKSASDKQIHKALKDISLTVDAAEYFGCEKAVIVPVKVTMPKKAQEIYAQMEKELFAKLEQGEVEAANAAAKTSKCLQIAGGAVYVPNENGEPSGEWEEVHPAKLDGLESIVEELQGAPLLVAYQYKHDVTRIQKRFPGAVVLAKGKKADQQIKDWNAGKISMFLVHPASAGHGLNLQDGGHHLALFNDTWNYEHYAQVLERIGPVRQHQAGHPRPVFVYLIQSVGTLDETVAERRDGKRSVQDLLLDYMKEKNR